MNKHIYKNGLNITFIKAYNTSLSSIMAPQIIPYKYLKNIIILPSFTIPGNIQINNPICIPIIYYPTLKNMLNGIFFVDADELIFANHNVTIVDYLKTIPDEIHQIYVIWKMFFGKDNNNTKMSNITTRFNYDFLHPPGGKKAYPQFFKDCGPMGRQPWRSSASS